jgi:Fic family protein
VRGTFISRVWTYDPARPAPARFRRPCEYEAFVPTPLSGFSPAIGGEEAGVVAEAERAIAALQHDPAVSLLPVARLLLRSESIASSKVEGMHLDVRALARAEVRHEAGGRIGADALAILANVDAMAHAIERSTSSAELRVDDLVEIHRVLMERAPNARTAGRIRTAQNWIGGNDHNPCGADFVPPPPEEVPRLLDDLCRFCSDETLPPLMHAALAHAQFETIHPFDDGNGRTGRALVQLVLRRRRLAPSFVPPISVVLAADRARYVAGLVAYREDRIGEWLTTFALAANRAAVLAQRYCGRVQALQESWRSRLRASADLRADSAAWVLIDVLPAHPVVTVPVGVAATRRSKPAVTNAVAELERAGVLRRLGEGQRNRAWEADGLLDLIADLEAGVD